jgi:membrane fusion protein, heavy metal efflux system
MRFALLLLAGLVFACNRKPDPAPGGPAPAQSSHDEHAGLPRSVHLSENVIRDAKIVTEPARKRALAETLALPGEIAVNPDRSARISSPVAGRLDRVSFGEGALVKKGDVLAQVRVPELGRVRGARSAALAKAKAARSNATRLKSLWESRLASEQSYLDALSSAEALEAEASSLGEQLRAIGAGASSAGFLLALRAPLAGVVVTRNAVVGQPVNEEQTLGSITDLSELWFLGRIFEKDLGRLKTGAKARVELNAYPGQSFEGTVEFVSEQIDPVARTLTARIPLRNADGLLRIGLFGTARVDTGREATPEPRLVVPESAVTEVDRKTVVFVREPNGDFQLHDVIRGSSALGYVEITSGLDEGEAVAVSGVFTLKSAVLKGTLGEEAE